MKKRSITSRNLAGGFLGGLLGILFFKLLYPVLLPAGCLIGVVIGFLYQEVWECICQSWKITVDKAVFRYGKSMKAVMEFRTLYSDIIDTCHRIARSFLGGIMWCVKTIMAVINLVIPILFICRWLKAHPMNRAYFIRWSVAGLFSAGFLYFAIWGVRHTGLYQNFFLSCSKDTQETLRGSWAILWMLLFMLSPMAAVIRHEDENHVSVFYHDYDRYSRLGAMRFALSEIRRFLSFQIICVSCITGVIGYFALFGGIFLVIIIVPLTAALSSLKGIYRITRKTRPWLCLGMTLLTTVTSAWLTHPYLNEAVWLWLVALATGTLSGLLSEGVRRLIAAFFARYEKFADFATSPLGEILAPQGGKFWAFSCWLADRTFVPMIQRIHFGV